MNTPSMPTAMLPGASSARPPGWGTDLAPERSLPEAERQRPADPAGPRSERPPPQPQHVQVLCSIEHNEMPPVFGTSVPPAGASGIVREWAFRYSEGDLRHWLLLLLADRVNVGEGLVSDLASGRLPNLPAEMGWRAEWRHNRGGAVRKLGLVLGVAALLYLRGRRRRGRRAADYTPR